MTPRNDFYAGLILGLSAAEALVARVPMRDGEQQRMDVAAIRRYRKWAEARAHELESLPAPQAAIKPPVFPWAPGERPE